MAEINRYAITVGGHSLVSTRFCVKCSYWVGLDDGYNTCAFKDIHYSKFVNEHNIVYSNTERNIKHCSKCETDFHIKGVLKTKCYLSDEEALIKKIIK